MTALHGLLWPRERLSEAVARLAEWSGMPIGDDLPRVPTDLEGRALSAWIRRTAAWMGVEAEEVEASWSDLPGVVANAAPAILSVPGGGWLVVTASGPRRVRVLTPDLRARWMSAETVRRGLTADLRAAHAPAGEALLDRVGLRGRRHTAALEALLGGQLGSARIAVGWILRTPAAAHPWRLVREAGLHRAALTIGAAHALQYGLFVLSWVLVGRGALSGRFDPAWLAGWALVLLTLVPIRMAVTRLQGSVAIGAATLLRRRMLTGALRLHPDEIRHQGVGGLLARVDESEAVESLALSGGLLALVAGIELVAAVGITLLGAGGWVQAVALVLWAGVVLVEAMRVHRRRSAWTRHRLAMTNDLVERMVGHRTRMAQEAPSRWHDGEDAQVARHLEQSTAMDDKSSRLSAVAPRGWLLVAVLTLSPALVAGGDPGGLAIGVGAALLALRALEQLADGADALSGAVVAWEQIAPLFAAAGRSPWGGAPPRPEPDGSGETLIEAHDLTFRYPGRPRPVLQGCDLVIRSGDRILLEGGSGGGKSTLAAMLVGLRQPDSGLLLVRGLDRATIGAEGWRQHAVSAPQFHENHVLTETFAFNLLMGREWPASVEDLDEAGRICQELGLGPLLDRMPGQLGQTVGETGWQLSHGERSRLFIARALLQRVDLVVLDESFAALDPENLRRALACVRARAKTLLVIAHP